MKEEDKSFEERTTTMAIIMIIAYLWFVFNLV